MRWTSDEIPEGDLPADALGETGAKTAPAFDLKLDGAKEGDVEIAFARLNVEDKDHHITEPGAFPRKAVPMSAYGHTSWPERGARLPVGRVDLVEEGDLAKAAGAFFLQTATGRETYEVVKALGELQEWSYGYKVLAASKGKGASGPVLRLKKLDVREVSPTLVGAGVGTYTIGIKSGDDDGPLAGLPYAEHVERVLRDVDGIVARSKGLRELRVKAGRELSAANRERLIRLRDSIAALDEQRAEVEELLARTDPAEAGKGEEAEAVVRLMVEHERTKARLLGVAVSVGG